MTRKISRVAKGRGERLAERITMNIHDLQVGEIGSTEITLFVHRYSVLMYDYYLSSKSTESLLSYTGHFSPWQTASIMTKLQSMDVIIRSRDRTSSAIG